MRVSSVAPINFIVPADVDGSAAGDGDGSPHLTQEFLIEISTTFLYKQIGNTSRKWACLARPNTVPVRHIEDVEYVYPPIGTDGWHEYGPKRTDASFGK
jgi:hypothetical protein